MMMKYYELKDDVHFPGRWYLGDILGEDNNWRFVTGQPIELQTLADNLTIEVYRNGTPMDYTTNGAFNVPIVSERLKLQLGGVKGLQFIPIKIAGKNTSLEYFIMVATIQLECVDEKRSIFGKFQDNDPVRPDKAGHYSWFTKLILNKASIKGEDIFRVKKTGSYLIISERVKAAMQDIHATGMTFAEV